MRSCSEPAITFAAKGITVSALPRKRFVALAIVLPVGRATIAPEGSRSRALIV
jgi:hypothetical protein